jgi:hypothetical protein
MEWNCTSTEPFTFLLGLIIFLLKRKRDEKYDQKVQSNQPRDPSDKRNKVGLKKRDTEQEEMGDENSSFCFALRFVLLASTQSLVKFYLTWVLHESGLLYFTISSSFHLRFNLLLHAQGVCYVMYIHKYDQKVSYTVNEENVVCKEKKFVAW